MCMIDIALAVFLFSVSDRAEEVVARRPVATELLLQMAGAEEVRTQRAPARAAMPMRAAAPRASACPQ